MKSRPKVQSAKSGELAVRKKNVSLFQINIFWSILFIRFDPPLFQTPGIISRLINISAEINEVLELIFLMTSFENMFIKRNKFRFI